jgi:hypothetical protein
MRYQVTLASVLTFCVLAAVSVGAQQEPYDLLFKSAEIKLDESVATIDQWARWAQFSLVIVVMIFVLGVVTAVVQAATFKYKGVLTALIGGLISGATLFSSTIIPADYKTLNELVTRGSTLSTGARKWLEAGRSATTDDWRRYALTQIEDRISKLAQLGIGTSQGNNQAALPPSAPPTSSFNPIAVVHAMDLEPAPQPALCGCFYGMPKGVAGDLFACGTGAAKSPAEAHDLAVFDAAKSLVSRLDRPKGVAITDQQLVDYVRRVATETDSCLVKGSQLSVMLRLPAGLTDPEALRAFAARAPLPLRLKVSSIKVVADGSAGDTGWRFDVFVDGRLVTKIGDRDYSDRPATQTVALIGRDAVEAPVAAAKGNYWLVEIRGQRTKAGGTVTGGMAVSGLDQPVEIPVTGRDVTEGNFLFKVAFTRP